jgi:hypothetical protein
VSGTVVDQRGEVRTGAKVTLVPVGVYQDRYDRFIAIHTDDDGRFRLEGVPAGPYMIYAWESIPVDAERNREFLALYRGRGQSLQIEQGGTVEVELRTIE